MIKLREENPHLGYQKLANIMEEQCLSDVESLNQDNPAPIRSNSMPLKKKTPTLKIIPTGKPPKKQLKMTSFLKRSSTAPTV